MYGMFTILHLLKTKFVKSNTGNRINERMETYCIHGSFMVFNKSYFTKGGTINYPSLLFGEELFVAETARKLGLKTIYEPDLVINHNEHSTTGVFKSAKTVGFMHQSYSYLLKTFFTAEAK
jgi:GT2 family glycosyltransferase